MEVIRRHLEAKEWTILTGARQVGKTTILRQLQLELEQAGKPVFYLTLEDPQLLRVLNEHPEQLFRYALQPEPEKERVYVLLDEVQYLADPTNFLKYLFDRYAPLLKLVCTGSSAFYIDQQFRDSLAGRKRIFDIHPLSFEEFLEFRGMPLMLRELERIRTAETYVSAERNKLQGLWMEYLTYGGYPAVVLQPDISEKKAMLAELLYSFIRKDMLESGVEEEEKFYQLMRLLAAQAGQLMNKAELANTLRINERTVQRYLHILRKCFHLYTLQPWSDNLRKEITKMPKAYLNDTGLYNALLRNFERPEDRPDKGVLLEHYIFHRLREEYDPVFDIHFWRTTAGQEVDFLVETHPGSGFALEAKWQEKEFRPSKYKLFNAAYADRFPLQPVCVEFDAIGHWVLKL
jgi:predicted AAA+ superfamily ATPase